ncbi:3-oxoacyl-[acyl-carrier-protein] synthase-3 [Lentzea xinjiangensis]|uniref:3-oxoacyl-[acyl-carrier-protein] synthase-3 n=1 Tax=Lentzea xinjiangensis TaxID=402600 RepID=A0A1H9HT23_9PSEU|nr:ketoacyl-ACP synthase III family protein [Lentzea xinjiangensis]SEQ65382.1 3-oxoacyl-[acyl-carrier-protein] synthase-3 [Lentzea xinjiangensis]
MRWDNLYIAGVGSYLPDQVETVDEAIAAGRYTEEKKAMNGYRAARVSAPGETGPVMAATAGRVAVERSGFAHDEFGVLVHSYVGHQGLDLWTPASYVQQETIGGSAPAYEVRMGCNAFVGGMDLAASYLYTHPDAHAGLVTGGDAFHLPYLDRWNSHEQNVDSDGGGAIVLSTRSGFARIRSMFTYGDPSLEPLGRCRAEWSTAPFPDGKTLQLDRSMQDYMHNKDIDLDEIVERISGGVQHSVSTALDEAGIELSDVRFFLHQQLAETIAEYGIYKLLGVDREKTTFDWGKDIGMVGTIDIVLGLEHVLTHREPKPGDFILLQCAGGGYVWTAAVVEILETPHWAS